MTITRVQTEALATLATKLRPDWRHAGVVAAIDKAAETTSDPFDIARALVNLASEGSVQTPALLAGPGPHWRNPDGSTPHRRGDNDVHCPEHPLSVHPCPQCAAKRCDPTPDYLEAKKALPKLTPPAVVKPPQLTDAESAALARKRADQEATR